MATLSEIAQAAIDRDALKLRALTQEFLGQQPDLIHLPRPMLSDPTQLAAAAALVELFALRQHQPPPGWAADIGPAPQPFFLVASALTMKHLRHLCETEAPEPLRKRGLYAPPNFLEFA